MKYIQQGFKNSVFSHTSTGLLVGPTLWFRLKYLNNYWIYYYYYWNLIYLIIRWIEMFITFHDQCFCPGTEKVKYHLQMVNICSVIL